MRFNWNVIVPNTTRYQLQWSACLWTNFPSENLTKPMRNDVRTWWWTSNDYRWLSYIIGQTSQQIILLRQYFPSWYISDPQYFHCRRHSICWCMIAIICVSLTDDQFTFTDKSHNKLLFIYFCDIFTLDSWPTILSLSLSFDMLRYDCHFCVRLTTDKSHNKLLPFFISLQCWFTDHN